MATIITRETGATAVNRTLTNTELDNNFINLNADIATRIPSSEKAAANGVATLDATGKVPSTQLPSYVDDVLEAANLAAFPATGETGKIYVALDTNKAYRWSGSTYIYITSGAVDSVAGRTGAVVLTKTDVGLSSVDNTADADKNVLTATKWASARTLSITGDISGSASVDGSANVSITGTLPATGVAAGSYGSATAIPVITVDAKGRLTLVSTVAVSIPSGSISVTGGDFSMSGSTGSPITNATLATVNSNVGTFNTVTVNAKGLVTSASNVNYLTSYTETDTLATVTARGNSTSTNIGATSGSLLALAPSGNIGTWLGGISDGTSGWALSQAAIGFKSDNNTYAAIGIGTANGILYFGRTTASGVGSMSSWLEVDAAGVANFKRARPQHNGNNLALVSEIPSLSGYLTSESDTLATVTARGATTSTLIRINNQLRVGQNTNGTAYIDAYDGYAWFGRDSNTAGIRIDGSGNVRATAQFSTGSYARLGDGTSNPTGTTFSHTLAGVGTYRVVNFDGNGNGAPSVWWTNGSRAYGAIDAQDPGLTFWANNGSSWQKQITLNYGSVNIDTVLQQNGNQVLHAGNYSSYAFKADGTISGDIDANWGQGVITFDPVPSGTPPFSSPNIRTLNIGNDFNRRTQLAFNYESDRGFFRRRTEGGWGTWREFIHSGNYSSYALPLSGGTILGRVTFQDSTDTQITLNGNGTTWTGITATDSGGTDYMWVYGATGTWSFGGGGSTVSGKKMHIHGGVTIGSGYTATANPSNGLNVEGAIQQAGNQVLHAGNYTGYLNSYSGPTSIIKQFFWDNLTAAGTQARTFEIARLGIDYNDWNGGTGPFEVELYEGYYSRGLKKKYVISWGYTNSASIQLVEYSGSGDNNFQCRIGTPVQVSGDNYYLPVYVDVRYYAYVDVRVTTNRDITTSNPPGVATTYINASPSATNISDFSADSTVNFASTTAVQIGGNQLLHAGNYTNYTLPLGGSWYGSGLPGSRWNGLSVSGGEIVFANGLPNAGQMGILVDGCYVAGENNGFWSMGSDNSWGSRRGMYWDGSYLNFTTNTPTARFQNTLVDGVQYLSNGNCYISQADGTSLRVNTAYGYIDIGPKNSSWCHIYSDKNIYTNVGIWINNNRVLDAGNYTGYDGIVRALGYISSSNDWDGLGNSYHNSVLQVDPSNFSSTSNGPTAASYTYGTLLNLASNSSSKSQIYISHAGNDLIFRGGWGTGSWQTWNKVLTNQNYNSYSPTLTGGGASGTWGISITGRGYPRRSDGSDLNFYWSGQSGQPTWLWGGSDGANMYVYNPSNFSVNYANSAGNATTADKVNGQGGYPHAGTGMYAFYNWGGSNGGASAPSGSSYTIGISVGSHPSDQAYGFQLARNMWNTGLWTRGYDSGWGSWVRLLDSSNYTDYAAPASHSHNYVPINPDGDGNAWSYADENPTINGVSIGGGQRFGADGSSYEGFLQAKIVNAYNGFVNSANGYYVGNYDFGANSNTYSTTQVIDGSGNVKVRVLTFQGEGGDSGVGSVAHSYGIYQQGGSWTYPYPDLCIGFHTGIKMGAHYSYGGIRFYNNSDWATQIMSIGESDNNIRINNTLYSYAYRGNSNVAGTGEATYHPAGIYSTSTNWLYGTIYTNGSGIYAGGAYSELTAYRANRANGNFYIDDNYGCGIVGVYSSYRYQGVFAMGDSYKLPADGTSVGSLYGMAWSHPNAGGTAGNLSSHGLLLLQNGGFMCALSTNIVASGSVTAYSDERLKTNWQPMPEDYVTRLAQVKVGIYDRTDQEDVTQVGVSAQSLQQLLPQAITTAKDEMQTLSVNYGGAALASAVELAKDNVELRARIERLESIIETLLNKE